MFIAFKIVIDEIDCPAKKIEVKENCGLYWVSAPKGTLLTAFGHRILFPDNNQSMSLTALGAHFTPWRFGAARVGICRPLNTWSTNSSLKSKISSDVCLNSSLFVCFFLANNFRKNFPSVCFSWNCLKFFFCLHMLPVPGTKRTASMKIDFYLLHWIIINLSLFKTLGCGRPRRVEMSFYLHNLRLRSFHFFVSDSLV